MSCALRIEMFSTRATPVSYANPCWLIEVPERHVIIRPRAVWRQHMPCLPRKHCTIKTHTRFRDIKRAMCTSTCGYESPLVLGSSHSKTKTSRLRRRLTMFAEDMPFKDTIPLWWPLTAAWRQRPPSNNCYAVKMEFHVSALLLLLLLYFSLYCSAAVTDQIIISRMLFCSQFIVLTSSNVTFRKPNLFTLWAAKRTAASGFIELDAVSNTPKWTMPEDIKNLVFP